MGIRGSISTMGLPDVFQWLKLGSKTGVLLVERLSRSTQVFFQKGSIADLREPDQAPVLLWFLSHAGFPVPEVGDTTDIAELLPQIAMRMAPGRADGTLQQSLKLLEEPLRNFFTNRLLDLFGWEFGEFAFRDSATSGRSLLVRPVDLEPLMLDWADRTLELAPLRTLLPDSPKIALHSLRGESASSSAIERRLLRLLRSPMTLLDLLTKSNLTEFETLKHLNRLVNSGALGVMSASEAPAEASPQFAQEQAPDREGPKTIWQQPPLPPGRDGALIAETFKRLRAELSGRAELTGLGPEAVPKMLISYDSPQLMHLKLSQDEGFLLSRVDGTTPLRQLASLSGVTREATAELILSLIVRGVLEATMGQVMIRPATVDKAEVLLQQALSPLSQKVEGSRGVPSVDIDWKEDAPADSSQTQVAAPSAAAAAHPSVPASPPARTSAGAAPPVAAPRPAAGGPAGAVPLTSPRPQAPRSPPPRQESESLAEAASMLHALHTPQPSHVGQPPAAVVAAPPPAAVVAAPPPAAVVAAPPPLAAPRTSAVSLDSVELSAMYTKLGLHALKEQDYRKAIQLLTDALAQDAENSNCWAALAQAYLMEGSELAEAERCCRQALEGNEWNSRLHLLLGYIQRSRDLPDQAAASFFRALELDHTNPQIQEALKSIQLR